MGHGRQPAAVHTWRAREALFISLGLLLVTLAPPTVLRFFGTPPPWLVEGWPLLANWRCARRCSASRCGPLSRQLSRLLQLAPSTDGLATADDLIKARMARWNARARG